MSKVIYDNKVIEYDDKFSHKDYTGMLFKNQRLGKLDGLTIYGSCFSQEKPDTAVFDDTMKDVTFVACNLDNVLIPQGNTVVGGSQKRFEVQSDKHDWVVDTQNKPIEPIDMKIINKLGITDRITDPTKLPVKGEA